MLHKRMLQYMKNNNYLTVAIVVLLSLAFVGCKGNGVTESNDGIVYPDGTAVEEPDNLVAYFDSLLRYTPAFIYTRNVDDIQPNPDSLDILNSIKALDDYQAHRIGYYPLDSVSNALGHLIYSQWYSGTHGDEDEMNGSEQFFFRYLEQVARLCPHVDYLTSIHTGDDKAGIFTGYEFSKYNQPYYCILLYRHGSGYRMKFLQYYVGYDNLWELTDSVGRNYLLCYNAENDIDWEFFPFKAILFLEEGENYIEACRFDGWLDEKEYFEQEVYIDYNPKTMTWTKCHKRGGKRIPIPQKERLRLVLDGKQSKFITTSN